jgi:hypothetical protein
MIEAITICINHSDFLAFTMPLNLIHFDKWIIVTDYQDIKTVKLCKYYGIQCVQTDAAQMHKNIFMKGSALNVGLELLSKKDWIVQVDADCALQPRFRHWIDWMNLDKNFIYGMDRVMFDSFDEWIDFYTNPSETLEGYHVQYKSLGGRLNRLCTDGYSICGYFQLWNGQSGRIRYPEAWAGNFGEDVIFSSFWPRNERGFIPEMVVYHLASEKGLGNNWRGRKTPVFNTSERQRTSSQIDRNGETKCQQQY